jgi:hypothetical protein
VIIAVSLGHDRRLADMLYHGHSVVRVNELVPDLETEFD